jgi:prolyl-tRNA synthetase
VVAAAVNGLYDVNETKLQHIVGGAPLQLARAETVKKVTGAEVGYAGFLNLPKEVVVVLDDSLKGRKNFEVGANHTNYHTINANFGRDYPEPDKFYDVAMAQADMLSPEGGRLVEKRGIEVGNIFQLGYHYTNLMQGAEYTNQAGKREKYYMGCYGIGIGRTMAAIVEAHHDEKGIIWPEAIAPYKVYLARLGDDKKVVEAADKLYNDLTLAGVAVLYDDRKMRPGEKFADADLTGVPYRIVISDKTIVAGGVYEFKARADSNAKQVHDTELRKLLHV